MGGTSFLLCNTAEREFIPVSFYLKESIMIEEYYDEIYDMFEGQIITSYPNVCMSFAHRGILSHIVLSINKIMDIQAIRLHKQN